MVECLCQNSRNHIVNGEPKKFIHILSPGHAVISYGAGGHHLLKKP